jgi:hypothetical protein
VFGNVTPILVPDGGVPWADLTQRFAECSTSLEPALREQVTTRLNARN